MDVTSVPDFIDRFGYPVAMSLYLIWDNKETKKMFTEKFDLYADKFDSILDKFDAVKEAITGVNMTMNNQFSILLSRNPAHDAAAMNELLIRNNTVVGGGT